MTGPIAQLDFVMRGGAVKRYHTVDTIKEQTVADHSYGVAWLCYLLSDGKPSAALLMAALAHDVPEHVTGDIPAPAKRKFNLGNEMERVEEEEMMRVGLGGMMDALTDAEKRTLKLADIMELMYKVLREMALGNRNMEEVFRNGAAYIQDFQPLSNTEWIIFNRLCGLYDIKVKK